MNQGRTVFSQLISFLPDWEFRRCVERQQLWAFPAKTTTLQTLGVLSRNLPGQEIGSDCNRRPNGVF
jgi:hypothetical protein